MERWTKEEEITCISLLEGGKNYENISKIIGRTAKSVKLKLNKLGLFYKDYIHKEILNCENCNSPVISKTCTKFCSASCAATFNNKKYPKRALPNHSNCLICNIKIHPDRNFCCPDHYQKYRTLENIKLWKETGKISIKPLKNYLADTRGYKCATCELSTWNSLPIVLEIEHIDGNSENNFEENVCLLCPNCHSQTPTYKGRNMGNGRHSRRERYAQNKSY